MANHKGLLTAAILFLFPVSSALAANLQEVGRHENVVTLLDTDSIGTRDGYLQATAVLNYIAVVTTERGKKIGSFKYVYAFDCRSDKLASVQMSAYAGANAQGAVTDPGYVNKIGNISFLVPLGSESPERFLMAAVCKSAPAK